MRVDKFITSQKNISRKDVNKLIKNKCVYINDKLCKSASEKVDEKLDKVYLNGEEIIYKEYVYIMMNKPKGVVSATEDKDETVIDIIKESLKRKNLFPIGRLDKDTTGLLVISDDGDFAHKVLSPKNEIYKTYIATLDKEITDDIKDKFLSGIEFLDGTKCKPAYFTKVDKNIAKIEICEGKFHQVKKMCKACSYEVVELHRERIGDLVLDSSLKPGECRELNTEEIAKMLVKGR